MTAVAESYLNPGQDAFREAEAKLPRYPYDPTRAASLMEELGYTRGPDGMFRDASGTLAVRAAAA